MSKCPDLRHQQGPLLRDQPLADEPGLSDADKTRSDRVPEDDVTAPWWAGLRTPRGAIGDARGSRIDLGRELRTADVNGAAGTYDADYIVVGSGAGGGTVAARLAESGFRVLLLEAGGDPRTLIGDTPQTPQREQPARRLRRAGVSRALDREHRHAVGLLRPPLRGRRASSSDPNYRGGRSTVRTWTACCTRAPARSAAAPRTTR